MNRSKWRNMLELNPHLLGRDSLASQANEVIEQLAKALQAARDHLEYCGYGDSYERECAKDQGLREQIERALGE